MKQILNLIFLMLIQTIIVNGQIDFAPSKQFGLQVYKAKTVNGTVTVNLPEKIFPGEIISGTVIAEPAPSTSSKKEKLNKSALYASVISIFGMNLNLENNLFQFAVPWNINKVSPIVQIITEKGKIGKAEIEILDGVRPELISKGIEFSGFLRAGEYQNISGAFDGINENSKLNLNEMELPVIAEAPGNVVTLIPEDISGVYKLTIDEAGISYSKDIGVVDLKITTNANILKKGQQCKINIKVSGLKGTELPVNVIVDNLTPLNINISGGNHQDFTIPPVNIDNNGIFNHEITVTAISSGGYTIAAYIAEPISEIAENDFKEEGKDQPVEENDRKELCGKTWQTDWKDTKDKPFYKQVRSEITDIKQKERCEICSKKTDL